MWAIVASDTMPPWGSSTATNSRMVASTVRTMNAPEPRLVLARPAGVGAGTGYANADSDRIAMNRVTSSRTSIAEPACQPLERGRAESHLRR